MSTAFDELQTVVDRYSSKIIFVNNDPIAPYDLTPGKIVIFTCVGDYYPYQSFSSEFDQLLTHYQSTGRLRNYYIILTNQNIPSDVSVKYRDIVTFIRIPTSYSWYRDKIAAEGFTRTRNLKRHFLSLNNRAIWYRHALFYFFVKHNLLDQAYFSYNMDDRFGVGQDQLFDELDATIGTTWYNQGLDSALLKSMIPYKIDDFVPSTHLWVFGDKNLYNESFCNITTETYNQDRDPFFTEKTFKPIAFEQPFFLYGSQGSLEYLKSLGFKTFDDVWDESYDQEPLNHLRFEKMLKQILEVSTWSLDKCESISKKLEPRLTYNKQVLMDVLPKQYDHDIELVKEYIEKLINDKQNLLG